MELITNPYLYTLGILIAYLGFRWGRKKLKLTPDWGIILITMLLSCASWYCVCALIFIGAVITIVTVEFRKPPKWL